jgi:TrpR-related protein YerC/YecD
MDWKKPENKRLIEAILLLSTPDEARRFLRDLMTKGELEEFAKRLRAAEMLTQKIPYKAIERETGFSSTTVARVARWLKGSEGGYGTVIKKLHHYNTHHVGRGLS